MSARRSKLVGRGRSRLRGVAVAAPWIVLLLMCLRPEAAAAYNSTTGVMVIAVGGLTTALGYMAMLRAARLPAERRLEL